MFADVDHRGWETIGDDCTLLPIGGDEALVVTTDMLVEDVHFVREATSAEELGRKALAVNLSDVAAMGLPAVATLLSVALPANAGEEWAREFIKGYQPADFPDHPHPIQLHRLCWQNFPVQIRS